MVSAPHAMQSRTIALSVAHNTVFCVCGPPQAKKIPRQEALFVNAFSCLYAVRVSSEDIAGRGSLLFCCCEPVCLHAAPVLLLDCPPASFPLLSSPTPSLRARRLAFVGGVVALGGKTVGNDRACGHARCRRTKKGPPRAKAGCGVCPRVQEYSKRYAQASFLPRPTGRMMILLRKHKVDVSTCFLLLLLLYENTGMRIH